MGAADAETLRALGAGQEYRRTPWWKERRRQPPPRPFPFRRRRRLVSSLQVRSGRGGRRRRAVANPLAEAPLSRRSGRARRHRPNWEREEFPELRFWLLQFTEWFDRTPGSLVGLMCGGFYWG